MIRTLLLVVLLAIGPAAAQVVIVSTAGLHAETLLEARVPDGSLGVVAGGLRGAPDAWGDLLAAGGWAVVAPRWDDPLELAPERLVSSDRVGSPRTWVVHDAGGLRVAVLAVTLPPHGHAAAELRDAEGAVREALADVPDGMPVVLVVAGDRAEAAALLRGVPRIALALVAGAGSGDRTPVRVGDAWLVEAPWGGAHWGVTHAEVDGERFVQVAHRIVAPRERSEAVAEAKRRHGLVAAPLDALLDAAAAPAQPAAPAPETAFGAALDGAVPAGANRAAIVRVHGARTVERYGDVSPSGGGALLVLEVEFENVIPLTLVRERETPTEYRFQDVSDHAYLVVNGTRLARLAPDAERTPGHLPVRSFSIDRPGERVRGNLVFELPAEAAHSLEFRLYDFAHGHVTMPLVVDADAVPGAAAAAEPLTPLALNEIVELGAYDLQVADALDGRTAPEGMTFVSVELRARSMFTFDADASAFDPHAAAGETTVVGTVSDWLEAHRYLHLVIDGVHAYTADMDTSTLPPEPRFLPDVMTGGRVVFSVPSNFASLTLRADFPNARLPDRSVIRPVPIEVALYGDTPAPLERAGLWSVRDDTLEVTLGDLHVADVFAGIDAGAGQRFIVLDVHVRNHGERPEWFQTAEQLRHADARGRQSAPHAATFAGPYRPTEPNVWVPDGAERTFQVAYLVGVEEREPRVAYRGFTLAETVVLPAIGE
ncbi:MAG: hypothetical protein EA416_17480 [Trueperaceae bacterium]|nr:MAG: hypothetical protein EA416_17480 [Trueperaceae bacterium]